MTLKIVLPLILATAAFSAITVYSYFNEDPSTLEAARSDADATLLTSGAGVTRYQVFGEGNAPTIIFVHSFNGFLESWNNNIDALVNAGYRVVAYDLYGRGLSDRPRVDYDLPLFRRQLASIVKAAGADSVHLVGSSFGCVIAADYATHHPEQVERLVLVGPAGWPGGGGRNLLLDVPIVADLAFHYFGQQILRPKVEAYLYDPRKHHDVVAEWARYATYPGFTRAALSTLRHSPVLDYTAGWKDLGKLGKPTLFIWGKQDVSFPFESAQKIPTLLPHATVLGIDNAAHWVNIGQAPLVNEALIEFLRTEQDR